MKKINNTGYIVDIIISFHVNISVGIIMLVLHYNDNVLCILMVCAAS